LRAIEVQAGQCARRRGANFARIVGQGDQNRREY
jgi:hypothetical protein